MSKQTRKVSNKLDLESFFGGNGMISFPEDYSYSEDDILEDLVISFKEAPSSSEVTILEPEIIGFGEDGEDLFSFEELDDLDFDDLDLQMDLDGDDEVPGFSSPDLDDSFRIPGAKNYIDIDEDDEKEEPEEEVEKDWENDRDPQMFMEYILSSYPEKIPSHDGKSTLGCERAIMFLTKLNKEISEALRSDGDDVLDLGTLEKVRVNMVRDIVTLKEHVKKLNKKLKKAGVESEDSLMKVAGSPNIQLVMTPFERAITGIIINSVVSAGKPFEDVYDLLKKKYSFTERDELSIMQILMDMGQPIFKDRGTIGDKSVDRDGHGVEFMKNYLA